MDGSELTLLAGELKCLSVILRNAYYLQSVSKDEDFTLSLTDVISDYLSLKSSELFDNKIEINCNK